MLRTAKRLTIALALIGAINTPALAQSEPGPESSPHPVTMAADLLVARPLGIAFTAVGSVIFVASLPFSAAGGNVKESAEALVVEPARETFVRCLGCTTRHRPSSR